MDNNANMMQLCRLCLVKDEVNIPIFEEQGDIRQIFLKISSCLPVKVSREDKLPKKICDGCSYKLDMLYEFWNTSANAEKQLLSWLGEAGMSAKMNDGHMSAVAQQIKPNEALVKEEELDPSDLQKEEEDDDDDEEKSYMFQQKLEENNAGPSVTATSNEEEEQEPPPPKRARRTAAVKAAIAMDHDSDDDDDSGEPLTKIEDESEESDCEDAEPAFVDAPSTSADDQAGPSGVGKDGADAPFIRRKINLAFKELVVKSGSEKYQTPIKEFKSNEKTIVKPVGFFKPCNGCVPGERCEDTQEKCLHDFVEKDFCEYCNLNGFVAVNHYCIEKKKALLKILQKKIKIEDKNSFFCLKCNEKLNIKTLLAHLDICLNDSVLFDDLMSSQCHVCKACFISDKELIDHLNNITCRVLSFCTSCSLIRDSTKDHDSTCGRPLLFCTNCGKNVRLQRLDKHECFHLLDKEEQHQNYQRYLNNESFFILCDCCGKKIPTPVKGLHFEQFHKKLQKRKPSQSYTCRHCNATFPTAIEYQKHRNIFHDFFLCHLCGKKLHYGKQRVHLDQHEDIKRYNCKKCKKSFRSKQILRKHDLVHSNIAKYRCPTCHKSFKTSFNLKVHKFSHAAVKPFECVICHKTYTTKQSRNNHLKTHKVNVNV